jgi:hypothetical protein
MVEQAAMMLARRVGSRMDGENNGDSRKRVRATIFYFYFPVDDSVAYWAVRASRPTNMRPDEMDALPTTLSSNNTYYH